MLFLIELRTECKRVSLIAIIRRKFQIVNLFRLQTTQCVQQTNRNFVNTTLAHIQSISDSCFVYYSVYRNAHNIRQQCVALTLRHNVDLCGRNYHFNEEVQNKQKNRKQTNETWSDESKCARTVNQTVATSANQPNPASAVIYDYI